MIAASAAGDVPTPAGAASAGADEPRIPPPSFPEACPLCGATLAADQEWCLSCGAAARTRLASPPGWQAPLALLLVLGALCLAVLAGALVKLARGSGPAPSPITRIVTSTAGAPATGTTAAPGTP